MLRAMSVWLPCSEVCRRNYRPTKFVTVSCWSVCGCVLLSEALRHVYRPTRCLLLHRQRSSVVCQLSTIVYTRASHPYRRPGTTTVGLAVQRRSCILPACLIGTLLAAYTRTASACHVCIWEIVLTEWIALEHGVNLLQQWRHCTSPQNLSFEITLNTWTFIVAM